MRLYISYDLSECDHKGGEIGQSYDIFALGCLYLHVLAGFNRGRAMTGARDQGLGESAESEANTRLFKGNPYSECPKIT